MTSVGHDARFSSLHLLGCKRLQAAVAFVVSIIVLERNVNIDQRWILVFDRLVEGADHRFTAVYAMPSWIGKRCHLPNGTCERIGEHGDSEQAFLHRTDPTRPSSERRPNRIVLLLNSFCTFHHCFTA